MPFIVVFWFYLTPNMLWVFVPLFLVGTFGESIVYGEIRLATASVLPAWTMHTIANTIANAPCSAILPNSVQAANYGSHLVHLRQGMNPLNFGVSSVERSFYKGLWPVFSPTGFVFEFGGLSPNGDGRLCTWFTAFFIGASAKKLSLTRMG
ncbi:MAG: hypothetical protein GY943_09780 [Chloroflexi bacterium]|nr:hypothetical protein [Chloroflexota bacterium]